MGRSLAGELAVRDGLVLVPLHPARLRERGYNQSMEIALGLAEVLGLPIYAGALQRCKNTRQPALLPAAGRRENLCDAFTPAGAVPLGILPWGRGRCVDDGGAMHAYARALGYERLWALVLARPEAVVT